MWHAPSRSGRGGRAFRAMDDLFRTDEVHSYLQPDGAAARLRVHATEGELVQSLQQVFGDYHETPVF